MKEISVAGEESGLVMVKVMVLVLPGPMLFGVKTLLKVGGVDVSSIPAMLDEENSSRSESRTNCRRLVLFFILWSQNGGNGLDRSKKHLLSPRRIILLQLLLAVSF